VRLFWVDGIYVQARLEGETQCLLVIIGATPESKKEPAGLADGLRESAQSWRGRQAGRNSPSATVAERAGTTLLGAQDRQHSQLPNSLHGKAKRALHNI
jgi:hypothetical protein